MSAAAKLKRRPTYAEDFAEMARGALKRFARELPVQERPVAFVLIAIDQHGNGVHKSSVYDSMRPDVVESMVRAMTAAGEAAIDAISRTLEDDQLPTPVAVGKVGQA